MFLTQHTPERGILTPPQWFRSSSLRLNNITPSLVHQYDKNRYYATSGPTGFPFTTVRSSNAMMFDSEGRMVWTGANMIEKSSTAGAVLGIIGSGGSMPTGWGIGSYSGLQYEVVNITSDYVDVRYTGTNAVASLVYPHVRFTSASSISITNNQNYTCSANVQIIAGSLSGFNTSNTCKITSQWLNSGAYVSEMTNSIAGTTTMQRLSTSGNAPVAGVANQGNVVINMTVNPSATVDITIRVGKPQFEPTGIDSPKAYIETTGTARYMERIAYNSLTLEPRGVQLEASATNNLAISETTNTSDWNNGSFCTATNNGTIWGRPIQRITVTSVGAGQFNYINSNSFTPSASTQYTASVFVKKGDISRVQFTVSANYTDAYMNYNFDTQVITLAGTSAVANTGRAELHGSGWVRLSFTFTSTASPLGGSGGILGFIDTDGATRLAGTATNGAYFDVFGFQLEAGNMPSSYIPTFGASVTRTADQPLLTTTGWYNNAGGVIYLDFVPNRNDPANVRRILDLSDGTANNRIQFTRNTTGAIGGVTSSAGTSEFSPNTVNTSPEWTRAKGALLFASGNKRIVLNGGTVSTATLNVPTSGITQVILGSLVGYTPGNSLTGFIREFRYYPSTTASDAQLQALTTL